jgi:hypothetical protein
VRNPRAVTIQSAIAISALRRDKRRQREKVAIPNPNSKSSQSTLTTALFRNARTKGDNMSHRPNSRFDHIMRFNSITSFNSLSQEKSGDSFSPALTRPMRGGFAKLGCQRVALGNSQGDPADQLLEPICARPVVGYAGRQRILIEPVCSFGFQVLYG